MRHGRAAGGEEHALVGGKMNGMREDGMRSQKSSGIVDIRVGFGGGEELRNESNFVEVFGDVGLDWSGRGGGGGKGAKVAEGFGGAGGGEARGDDWPDQGGRWVESADVGDCGFCSGEGGGCGFVAVVFWADSGVIHADAADEGALTLGVADCGEEVGGRDMDGCVVGSTGGAMGEGAGYDAIVDRAGRQRRFRGIILVAEGGFQWKGVCF